MSKPINRDTPIYNSRLLSNYIEYVEKYYPDVDVGVILEEKGISRKNVENPGHWFSQNEIDLVCDELMVKTQNMNLGRDVGRFLASSESFGIFRRWVLGFLGPLQFYMLFAKASGRLTIAHELSIRRLGSNSVEVTVKYLPGVQENLRQCRNRIGALEAAGKLFLGEFSKVEHSECVHSGGSVCRYSVSWRASASFFWKRVLRYASLFFTLLLPAIYFLVPLSRWWEVAGASLFTVLILYVYAKHKSRNEMMSLMKKQGDVAGDHLREINMRYNNALLFQEIAKTTSTVLELNAMVRGVLQTIRDRMNYGLCLVMFAGESGEKLRWIGSSGESPEDLATPRQQVEFSLVDPESTSFLVSVFKERKSVLVNDSNTFNKMLSPASREAIGFTGIQSVVCVPCICEEEVIGVIAVANRPGKRFLSQSDLNLLEAVAFQIATGAVNIRESEKRYRELVENAGSIIMRTDREGRITFFNEFAEKLFGFSREELSGEKVVGTIFPFSPANSEYFRNLALEIEREPSKQVVSEKENITKSGDPLWVAWTHRPVMENGRISEILFVGTDIGELKASEREKVELRKGIEEIKKLEAIGTIAGGVAHDLNNILSGLVGYPELLLVDLPEDSPLRKPVEIIRASGERARIVVDDLLTLARRGVSNMKVMNFNSVVTEFLEGSECEKLKKDSPGVHFEVTLEKDLLNISGSKVQLSKTVMNLVLNAIQGMPGVGKVSITTKNLYVDPSFAEKSGIEEGDYITFSVADEGEGLSDKDRESIFEPFYTKKVMGRPGTGLGMAVIRGIVKDHKGHISIETAEGTGTTFTIFIPADRENMTGEEVGVLRNSSDSLVL